MQSTKTLRFLFIFKKHSNIFGCIKNSQTSLRYLNSISDSNLFKQKTFYDALLPYRRLSHFQKCYFSTGKIIKVPKMTESVTEGTLSKWEKKKGDFVEQDELVAVIDTDKVSFDINAPEAGVIIDTKFESGATVMIGDSLFVLDTTAKKPSEASQKKKSEKISEAKPKEEKKKVEDAVKAQQPESKTKTQSSTSTSSEKSSEKPQTVKSAEQKKTNSKQETTSQSSPQLIYSQRTEQIVPMTRLRKRVAERLKTAQNTAACLTTFNECDMGSLMTLRSELNKSFQKKHGLKFGFVSAFLYASAKTLMQMPHVNGYISEDGNNMIHKNYVDISVAVATKTGLLVPVIRDCEKKTIAELEKELASLAARAREGKIALEDMMGGTFTISNGGVFGSLMGTPIINPPQSSILGLHSIKERPIVQDGEIVIRPMMYLALTYDHRLLDGREAVTFLNSIKEKIEDPRKMLLNL